MEIGESLYLFYKQSSFLPGALGERDSLEPDSESQLESRGC